MTSSVGVTLIWVSWLYVAIAVVAAKLAYRRVKRDNPDYFSDSRSTRADPLKIGEARGIFDLVMDDAIERRGFSASTSKLVTLIKIMYLTAPLALLLFAVGIFIR
jgi:hypothetical protein